MSFEGLSFIVFSGKQLCTSVMWCKNSQPGWVISLVHLTSVTNILIGEKKKTWCISLPTCPLLCAACWTVTVKISIVMNLITSSTVLKWSGNPVNSALVSHGKALLVWVSVYKIRPLHFTRVFVSQEAVSEYLLDPFLKLCVSLYLPVWRIVVLHYISQKAG